MEVNVYVDYSTQLSAKSKNSKEEKVFISWKLHPGN
jgi:hypothetical protein